MNVVYTVNDAWLKYALVSARSVKYWNPDANIYIVTDSQQDTEYPMIKPCEMNIRAGKERHFTRYSLLRLYLPRILDVDKAIYLDTDTICCGALDELWNTEVECVAGVKEVTIKHITEDYINAGVMMLNLKEFGKYTESLELAVNEHDFTYPDQDAINTVCPIKLVDNRFNQCMQIHCTGDCEEPAIIHYTWWKPWDRTRNCENKELWWRYAEGIR